MLGLLQEQDARASVKKFKLGTSVMLAPAWRLSAKSQSKLLKLLLL